MHAKDQSGNVLVYVLILIALFAALSMVLSRNTDTAEGDILNEERIGLMATNLTQQAFTAQQVMDQMVIGGSRVDQMDFMLPSDGGFNTGSALHRVYHPDGGGLSYKSPESYDASFFEGGSRGWIAQTATNVDWTPSATNPDIIYTFADVHSNICARLNQIITGNTAIPVLSDTIDNVFNEGAGTDADLDTGNCPLCEGQRSLCIEDSAGQYAFYNVLIGE